MPAIIALDGLGVGPAMLCAQVLRDEQVYHVFTALIDDGGDRLAVDIIEASAQKRKALR